MQSRFLAAALVAAVTLSAAAQMPDRPAARPKITGISHIAVYTSDPVASEHYYVGSLGAVKQADPENPKGTRYAFSAIQFVEVLPLPADAGVSRLDHVAFNTEDAAALHLYLARKAWKVEGNLHKGADGSLWFTTKDPEGNKVEFVQPPADLKPLDAPNAIGRHIIHVGYLVHNRAFEDTFFRDLLGFRPYWYGGSAEGRLDWVSQQVPDGHDWLEYMVVSAPGTGIPADMTQQHLGVMDHFSVGEVSVPDAFKELTDGNRLAGRHDAAPKIGLDGKYQFNMYDPDGIRAELMNFHATNKPCCSAFTADDPAQ